MHDPRDPQEHYARFANLRASRAHLLKSGERWLTLADLIQPGDCYLANPSEWWEFVGPKCSGRVGQPIGLDCFCYTPKGSINRLA